MLTLYPTLIDQSADDMFFAEKAENIYTFFNERHIQAMWFEQKYFKPLYTSENKPITVISPGIWNAEAGPDFLKAHLLIGNEEFRGDIELHLTQDSWYHHQHHADPRYNHVILHISYWHPNAIRPLLTANGRILEHAYLENNLTISESRIIKLIDLDLYPYKRFVGNGKCADTLFRKIDAEDSRELFRSAALWRLKQKRNHLLAQIDNRKNPLTTGIAIALGYKKNAQAFLKLYTQLLEKPRKGESYLLSYALGLCGFFESSYRNKWFYSTHYQSLAAQHDALNISQEEKIVLNLDKIRPANHPVRRLAALTKLIYDPMIEVLLVNCKQFWKAHWTNPEMSKRNFAKMRRHFFDMIPSYQDPYWSKHYGFESEENEKAGALIGNDLKREIMVNVILPLLFEDIETEKDSLELQTFVGFYDSLPAQKSRKAQYLNARFFGESDEGHILSSAEKQQGAFQIHKDFCIHYEASCQGCPFVEKYKQTTKNNCSDK